MPKLAINSLVILSISATAFGLTSAFFSDTETSTANVLAAGSLDLKIDNTSYYNLQPNPNTTWPADDLPGHLFFDFADIKPGDIGEDTISLFVQNNAWACMKVSLTANDDVSCTEPELLDDPTCTEPDADLTDGELAALVNFAFWADDGDNVYETGETIFKSGSAQALFASAVWTLADSTSSIWSTTPAPLPGGQTSYVGKVWCLGTLTPAAVPAGDNDPTQVTGFTCDGTALTNASQTDKLLADVEFTAIQARNNSDFTCSGPTPTVTPTPTPIACTETFAASVISSDQGTRKNGTAVLADRINPAFALGAPQSAGSIFDTPVVPNSFFSLGFKIGQSANGSLVVSFAQPFHNQPGPDLQVYEVTGGPPYPDEKVRVEVSPDGSTWTQVSASLTKDGQVDIAPVATAQYVRLTDVSDINLFEPTADAYDVDAVKALCGSL